MDQRSSSFDFGRVFSDDYLYFNEQVLSAERSMREVEAIWRLLDLSPGSSVLDIGCGHGRISNRLAEKGARVTGLDSSSVFLSRAKRDAELLGVDVKYLQGDMRSMQWSDCFDAGLLWYTTFGYFEEDENEAVIQRAFAALRSGGRLLIDQLNRAAVLCEGAPCYEIVRRGDDFKLDISEYDARTERNNTERLIVREGIVRRMRLSIRLYGVAEYMRILHGVGFGRVELYGKEGGAFDSFGQKIIVVAHKP